MARTARTAPPWLLALLACPQDGCGARLGRRGASALVCRGCGMLYPVLAGVPLLVPAPHAYCASYRESILATLAEVGALDRATLAVIDAFADAAPGAEPMRFGDDWTARGALARWPDAGSGLAARLRRFLAAASGFEDELARLAPDKLGVALELGCGDGELARRIAPRARRLVLGDLSLRAVLRARAACRRDHVAGVVLDAGALPVQAARFDSVLAINLIDLLERPLALPHAIADALKPGGQLVLSSPDPELGGDDAAPLYAALRRAGLGVEVALDQLPWLRLDPPRHAQVYLCLVVLASRAKPRGSGRARRRA